MKKESVNWSAAALALLPVYRFINRNSPALFSLLCVGVCLFFLLRGLYFHLCKTERGRAFFRRIPLLKVPQEDDHD